MARLEELSFDNTFARLPGMLFQRIRPTPIPAPYLVSFSPDVASLLGLDASEVERPEFREVLAGVRPLAGSEPIATLYAGHQFGGFVPQLGDGRAILLGEVVGPRGKWDVQLKGAGATAFSRAGDGRAVLRSSIREYLCSEAMHGLGIPTTRGLAVVGSDLPVYREEVETAAVLARVAPSHVRFGHFEVLYYRGQHDLLRVLADYVIDGHFRELSGAKDRFPRFLAAVVERTASLMAQWQAVGFAHGVMNTDNMSVLGLTIDYGPFGFLDDYDPRFICNHSDDYGRYAFDQQPRIGLWNCKCLAQALLPLMTEDEAIAALDTYLPAYNARYATLMKAKLGLTTEESGDASLVEELLKLMAAGRTDYTKFFRDLGKFQTTPVAANGLPRDQILDREAFDAWAARYRERCLREGSDDASRRQRMDKANPKYVLRNAWAQEAIRLATGKDFSEVDRLLALLRHPYDEQPEMQRYAEPPPAEIRHVEVSCSS
jgi:uncharacterized protein YdiU (UPF0061 family)